METLTKIWTIINILIVSYMYQYGLNALLVIILIAGLLVNVLILLGYLNYITGKNGTKL